MTNADFLPADDLAAIDAIQRRALWLAVNMVHHANHVRPNTDGTKIGGHQASSASMVTILTALYTRFLRAGDRVAVKPHASPVFHALQYLMGNLDQRYLTELRTYKGLQAYPSRTKDPDQIDFSMGSVGLGAVAPAFAALASGYCAAHFGEVSSRRFIATMGDAELDEGNVWEALLDEALSGIQGLIWIVDLNRQSLDRVVPGIRAARLKRLFEEHGWRVLEAKYGRQLQARFAGPGGAALRACIDTMPNEEYQALIRRSGAEIRARLGQSHSDGADAAAAVADLADDQLAELIANLGGHDLEELLSVLDDAASDPSRPAIVFAYTIKGWGLPIAGHPLNHSMLLNGEQIDTLRTTQGLDAAQQWDAFPPDSAEAEVLAAAVRRLTPQSPVATAAMPASLVPDRLDVPTPAQTSTQDAFGRILVRVADVPGLRERVVTTSPDVSVSTNLAGWINKTGVFTFAEHPDYETEAYRLLRWQRGPTGQHIELGISEMNLFMLLGMFGLSAELCGQPLIPIGTVYDPFVCRGLDALIYAIYSGAKFIVAGTPSGITLAPEGGAHQSNVTSSLGIELPGLETWEPAFAREVEWAMLDAMRQCCDREHGRPSFLRLTTRPIDQQPFDDAMARLGEPALRAQVLRGGYRLIAGATAGAPEDTVQIVACGVMVAEAVAAAHALHREGVAANVIVLTSPRRVYEAWRNGESDALDWLIPRHERHAPIITVHDSSTHSLAWLGSVYGAPLTALGVDAFGQSGARDALYTHYGIDTPAIVEAAFAALDRRALR